MARELVGLPVDHETWIQAAHRNHDVTDCRTANLYQIPLTHNKTVWWRARLSSRFAGVQWTGAGYQAFIPLGNREKVKFPVASGQPRPGISALRDEEGHRLMPRLGLCRRDTSAASNPTGIWRHGKLSVTTGDGERVSRPLISATDLPLFRSHSLHIPFNDSEKHWVRFSDGDSASNGALYQPTHLE